MKIEIIPGVKEIISRPGEFCFPAGPGGSVTGILIADEQARRSAELIAERYQARVVSGAQAAGAQIRLNIVPELDFAGKLDADRRVEAYRLEVSEKGIALSALTAEGLLRGAATLFQMARLENGSAVVPCVVINDWPNFRYRCGVDWLLNVEINRWSYDWGDGRGACLKRIKRKLDFCFAHKINMVWFDGFGWNTERFPGYAALMQEFTSYARRLGIKLVFAGYSGGYGMSYQVSEIYKGGYFGNVYRNRRPYPDGAEYDCCGLPKCGGKSRRYGTCLSNESLKRAKLEELKRFVSAVQPGFMYLHDIDAGVWQVAQEAWKQRCGECRQRWPSDELSAADGQAGAYASWFKQLRSELSALPPSGDYSPARDLYLIFISPLYTSYDEGGDIWEREMQYFDNLSRLIGPAHGVIYGMREQFYDDKGRKKILSLREVLEKNGSGHGIDVAAFGGGDNYITDDLANISGTMAHFYDGARSVHIANGGVHEEPVQLLNADCLWSGSAGGYRANAANQAEAVALWGEIAPGKYKPAEIFGAGGFFDRACGHLWGREAGLLMSRAIQARSRNGRMPVSRVWWAVTRMITRLSDAQACSQINWGEELEHWTGREQATILALESARQAAGISDDEDIRWFARCLEVGRQFAEAVKLLVLLKSGRDKTARARLDRVVNDLEAHIRKNFKLEKTDVLGGDPGCWLETIAQIRPLAESLVKK